MLFEGTESESSNKRGKAREQNIYDVVKAESKSENDHKAEMEKERGEGLHRPDRKEKLLDKYEKYKINIETFLETYKTIDLVQSYQQAYNNIQGEYPELFKRNTDGKPQLIANITDGRHLWSSKGRDHRDPIELKARQAIGEMEVLAQMMIGLDTALKCYGKSPLQIADKEEEIAKFKKENKALLDVITKEVEEKEEVKKENKALLDVITIKVEERDNLRSGNGRLDIEIDKEKKNQENKEEEINKLKKENKALLDAITTEVEKRNDLRSGEKVLTDNINQINPQMAHVYEYQIETYHDTVDLNDDKRVIEFKELLYKIAKFYHQNHPRLEKDIVACDMIANHIKGHDTNRQKMIDYVKMNNKDRDKEQKKLNKDIESFENTFNGLIASIKEKESELIIGLGRCTAVASYENRVSWRSNPDLPERDKLKKALTEYLEAVEDCRKTVKERLKDIMSQPEYMVRTGRTIPIDQLDFEDYSDHPYGLFLQSLGKVSTEIRLFKAWCLPDSIIDQREADKHFSDQLEKAKGQKGRLQDDTETIAGRAFKLLKLITGTRKGFYSIPDKADPLNGEPLPDMLRQFKTDIVKEISEVLDVYACKSIRDMERNIWKGKEG